MQKFLITLCTILLSLGISAQSSVKVRTHRNPNIDGLIQYLQSLNHGAEITYLYDGKHHKRIRSYFHRTNRETLIAETDQEKRLKHLRDSINDADNRNVDLIEDSIRNTFFALSDNAKECYQWEYHKDGVDSINFALAMGEYAGGDTLKTYEHQHDRTYYNAPECLIYRYMPAPQKNGFNSIKGYGNFFYEYTADSTNAEVEYIDKKAYGILLKNLFKQKGVSRRKLHISSDSTYTVKQAYEDDEVVWGHHWIDPVQSQAETNATIYSTTSEKQAYSLLKKLIDITWKYIDEHPHTWYNMRPHIGFSPHRNYTLFESENLARQYQLFGIYLFYLTYSKEYCFIVLDGKGEVMLPSEWDVLKSWKKGKKTYDQKRKALRPEEFRWNFTSYNRGQYTVINK